jgi:hypothetical protein
MTLTHAVSIYDQKKSECIASWWGDHREERQKLIDEKLAQYPSIDSPTTIVIGLVTKACGSLVPQQAR